jgi:hypothetical protein
MTEKTAVDWLWDQFVNQNRTDYLTMLEEAKEMHRNQVVKGVKAGFTEGIGFYIDTENGMDNEFDWDEYYKQTYGSE